MFSDLLVTMTITDGEVASAQVSKKCKTQIGKTLQYSQIDVNEMVKIKSKFNVAHVAIPEVFM